MTRSNECELTVVHCVLQQHTNKVYLCSDWLYIITLTVSLFLLHKFVWVGNAIAFLFIANVVKLWNVKPVNYRLELHEQEVLLEQLDSLYVDLKKN